LWRYLTVADAKQYAERLRRYNALVVDRSYYERKALPKSMELLNYLTANGWPENFLYASTEMQKSEPCVTMDFKVDQYSFEVEVAIIENVSAKPITISQLFGQAGGSNQLRRAASSPRTTGRQVLPGEPVTLAPSSRLIVPLRLVFAADDPVMVGLKDAASQAKERKQAQESFRKIMARPPGAVFRTEIYSALRGNTRGKDDTYVIRKVRESFKPPSYPSVRTRMGARRPRHRRRDDGVRRDAAERHPDHGEQRGRLLSHSPYLGRARGDLDPPRQGAPPGADARPRSERDRAIRRSRPSLPHRGGRARARNDPAGVAAARA